MQHKQNELKIFLENVVCIRKYYGIPKKRMAQLLGIGIKSLNKIEAGECPLKMGADIVFNIYKNFRITPREMFEGRLDMVCCRENKI